MLSTNIPLKCNRKLSKPYFQYPVGLSPGDFDPLPPHPESFLKGNTLAHRILLEILPGILGMIIFTFFLISSCFIIYGVLRGFYTDRMLPRRNKILKKLGKLPEEKRRKYFRSSKKKRTSHGHVNTSIPSMGDDIHRSPRQPPYYMNGLISEDETSTDEPFKRKLSFTTPPLYIDKNSPLPTIPKSLQIPGSPFPILPDAPLNKTRNAATSPMSKRNKSLDYKPKVVTIEIPDEFAIAQPDTMSTLTIDTPQEKNTWDSGYNREKTQDVKSEMQLDLERIKKQRADLRENRLNAMKGHGEGKPGKTQPEKNEKLEELQDPKRKLSLENSPKRPNPLGATRRKGSQPRRNSKPSGREGIDRRKRSQ